MQCRRFGTGRAPSCKLLQPVQQRGFQVGLAHHFRGLQAQEFEDVGVADDLGRRERLRPGLRKLRQGRLVGGQAAALPVQAGDLPLELAHRPLPTQGLDFVEAALLRLAQLAQQRQV